MTRKENLRLQLNMRALRAMYLENVRKGVVPLNKAVLAKWDKTLGVVRENVPSIHP